MRFFAEVAPREAQEVVLLGPSRCTTAAQEAADDGQESAGDDRAEQTSP